METKWTEVRDILSTFPIFVGQILWVGWKVENALGPGVFKRNTHRLIYFSCYSLHSFHSTFLVCVCVLARFISHRIRSFLLPFCVYCLFKMIWCDFLFSWHVYTCPYIHPYISSSHHQFELQHWIQWNKTKTRKNKVYVEFLVFHQIKILLHI